MFVYVSVAVITVAMLLYRGDVSTKKFLNPEDGYLLSLKEKDYDFYVASKYGEKVNPNVLFMKRITNAFYIALLFFAVTITQINFINIAVVLLIAFFMFKLPYMQLRNYYKKYMHQIDMLLPYFLKNLEILCQNYTVPVALSRSIESAPEVFRQGLREMIAKIDAGDSSIQPYMDFALKYPVRDSMRMMRLLYRLGLGAQENKYKQLLIFSKSVSSLQNKAREVKYKNRLDTMEKKTMIMLFATGGGTMAVLLIAMMMMFGSSV